MIQLSEPWNLTSDIWHLKFIQDSIHKIGWFLVETGNVDSVQRCPFFLTQSPTEGVLSNYFSQSTESVVQ